MAAFRCFNPKKAGNLRLPVLKILTQSNRSAQIRFLPSFAEKRKSLEALDILCTRNPTDQGVADLTKAYRISIKDMKKVFSHGFPTRFSDRVIDFQEFHMVIRKPSLDVITGIREMKAGDVPLRYVFYGDDGVGKSISLSHVIHYCAMDDWLILHVPSVHHITTSKEPVEPSAWREGRIDQPQEAAHWLKSFKTVNQSFLDKINTSQDYKWGRQEVIAAGSSITKVVDTGMSRTNFAADAVGIVLKEVKNAENLKVLYAIDAFNHLFTTSSVTKKDGTHAHPQDLSLVRHFTRMLSPDKALKSGCYVMALTRQGCFETYSHSTDIKDQIGEMGMTALGDHRPVLVENFSPAELHNYLLLLKEIEMLHTGVDEQVEKEISFLTDGNPSDINRLIKGF